jgi:DNA repair protein RecO (recombination protein O)
MDWRDTAFVLNARRHGESALVVELLTAEHGRHAGLVRGGQSPRRRALLQPGNAVAALWRGRLAEHLGTLECELLDAHAARLLDDPGPPSGLNAATALLAAACPSASRIPTLRVLRGLLGMLDSASPWARPMSRGNAALAGLGFGLELGRCAVTGTNQDLAYVSPRTAARCRATPARRTMTSSAFASLFMAAISAAEPADIVAGLILTRHFLLAPPVAAARRAAAGSARALARTHAAARGRYDRPVGTSRSGRNV